MKKSFFILIVIVLGAFAQWGCASSGDGPDVKVNNPNVTSDPSKPPSSTNVGKSQSAQSTL